jgi:hypothetical protein
LSLCGLASAVFTLQTPQLELGEAAGDAAAVAEANLGDLGEAGGNGILGGLRGMDGLWLKPGWLRLWSERPRRDGRMIPVCMERKLLIGAIWRSGDLRLPNLLLHCVLN